METDSFGSRLNMLLRINNCSVKEFGKFTGLSPTIFYKYFNNKATPSVTLLQKIIEKWPNTNLYWLLTGDVESTANEINNASPSIRDGEAMLYMKKVKELEEKLSEKEKEITYLHTNIESQNKALDLIIEMLKERGIHVDE